MNFTSSPSFSPSRSLSGLSDSDAGSVAPLDDKCVFMLLGYGDKSQFKSMHDLEQNLFRISNQIPDKSRLLYFGDAPKADAPDVGYAIQLLTQIRPDITVHMIQINEAKDWGIPDFVRPENVFWHSDYDKSEEKCSKWGGFDSSGKPCSSTKQWVELHHQLPQGITKVFALGGGNITLQELAYAKKIGIPVRFIPMERRFKGDMKTELKETDSIVERYGGDVFLKLLHLNHDN